ncbi:MAG: cytidylate kinase-like family protein [Oscillospiraceae bacterium]
MSIKSIITIGRQYGSGGRAIGKKLADDYGIPFYDNKLLEVAAKDSGISKEFFESNDEKPVNSLLYILSNTYSDDNLPFNHKIFLAQFEAVKKIAEEGPCVFVGRCADYALRDYENCVNLFVHASMESRIERSVRIDGIPEKKAEDIILKIDKQRASYYNFYTCQKWGRAENYDLSFDSSILGIDKSVEFIKAYISAKEAK